MKNIVAICLMFVSFTMWSQEVSIDADLIAKVAQAKNEVAIGKPNPMDPLAMNATLVWSEDKSQVAVVMVATLLEGWHIYSYVPETQPYIQTKLKLSLPEGIIPIKEWEKPDSVPYEGNIFLYKNDIVFVRYCKVSEYDSNQSISPGIYYQTCDVHKCFPPVTKTKKLNL